MTKQNIEKIHNITMIMNQMDKLLTSLLAEAKKEDIPDEDLQDVLDEFPDFPEDVIAEVAKWGLKTFSISMGLSDKFKDKE